MEAKCKSSLRYEFGQFNVFRKNYAKFLTASNLMETPTQIKKKAAPKDDDFVFIPSKWQFRPDNLTEHQKEKLKKKSVDIPALYNDMSQSQDSQSVSLKPWTPSKQMQSVAEEVPSNEINSADDPNKLTTPNESEKLKESETSNELPSSPKFVDLMENAQIDAINNTSSSLPAKRIVDADRRRTRVQNELKKLQLSLNNAKEFSEVKGRTRRMSVSLSETPIMTRKRTEKRVYSTAPASNPQAKRVRLFKNNSSTQSKHDSTNDSSDVIEASQPMQSTPTIKERRASRLMSSSKKQKMVAVPQDNHVASPIKSMEISEPTGMVEMVAPVDQSKVVTTEPETELKQNGESVIALINSHNAVQDDEENELSIPGTTKETNAFVIDTLSDTTNGQATNDQEPTNAKEKELIVMASIPNAECLTTTTDGTREPHHKPIQTESNVDLNEHHGPAEEVIITNNDVEREMENLNEMEVSFPTEIAATEVVYSTGTSTISDECLKTPIHKRLNIETSNTSRIVTSPINQNESKTNELLSSTVDISPILHSKAGTDRTNESLNNSQALDDCIENIETSDQPIQRSELDSLIRPPIDSPMMPTQKMTFSTPQSNKGPKSLSRKFQLQGRGAQLLQLMNIRKIEDDSSKAKTSISIKVTPTTEPSSNNASTYEDILASNKDLFRFSKVLPSPKASPSNSIMKKNLNEISHANEDIESPQQKRKRVSFHDPPVSTTKEFICFEEEVNNRNRATRNSSSMKKVLSRKNRTDSLFEIRKFTLNANETTSDLSDRNDMKSLNWDSNDDEEINVSPPISFSNKDSLLQHVFEEYPIDELLSKYVEAGFTFNSNTATFLTKQLSNLMDNDEITRKEVLENLSEKYSNEFLDVTLQENLISTVLERLSPSNLLEYIIDRTKIDGNLKMQLMDKFSTIIDVDADASANEMSDELYKVLSQILSHKMNDKQLIEVLEKIFQQRRTMNNN